MQLSWQAYWLHTHTRTHTHTHTMYTKKTQSDSGPS